MRSFSDFQISAVQAEIDSLIKRATGGNSTEVIDSLARKLGYGALSDAYRLMLSGINHRGLGNPVRTNRDNSGIIFFTRPDLNLTYDNIAYNRLMSTLGTKGERSAWTIQNYIQNVLDVRSSLGGQVQSMYNSSGTPLFNKHMPFIPVLTNNLLSMSGWPDIAPETYTSKEGVMKEQFSMIDGYYRVTNQFDLTANFRNTEGDPITALFNIWILYACSVYRGDLFPYPENIIENRIDYTTRIYHFTLDPTRRFITHSAATGASFPTTIPIGASFNFVGDNTYVQSTEQLSINFNSVGADYNDPITFYEFNKLVSMFEPALRITSADNNGGYTLAGGDKYVQLTSDGGELDMLQLGNYYGIPLIHPYTQELMWFVKPEEVQTIAAAFI